MGQQPSTQYRQVGPRTPDGEVAAVRTVAIVPGTAQPILDIRGDYGQAIPSPGQAAAITTTEATGEVFEELAISGDPSMLLLAPIILPLAAIAAAATAKVRQRIQDARDALTDDIAEDAEQSSPSFGLAETLLPHMARVPHLEPSLVL
jgi:hypothetical protein